MSQGHFDDKARRLQSETHSSQPVRVKSAPSTSDENAELESHESGAYEVNANVNTPCKNPSKMYPIPEFPRGKYSKRKRSATIITSKNCLAKNTFEVILNRGGRFCKKKNEELRARIRK
jgi:hypothetical protein